MILKPKVPLNQPWDIQVNGGWWRSLSVIIIYFVVRTILETRLLTQGLIMLDVAPVDANNYSVLAEAMSANPTGVLFKEIILLLLIFGLLKLFQLELFDLKAIDRERIKSVISMYFVIFLLLILFSLFVERFFPSYETAENQQMVEIMFENLGFLPGFMMIVIGAPIVEEIIFRGLIMKYMFSNIPWLGAFVGSVLFVFLHSPSNILDFISYFILSAPITYMYWRSRKLEDAIMLHMIQNGISFIGLLSIMKIVM